jgi:hypothetical protein
MKHAMEKIVRECGQGPVDMGMLATLSAIRTDERSAAI